MDINTIDKTIAHSYIFRTLRTYLQIKISVNDSVYFASPKCSLNRKGWYYAITCTSNTFKRIMESVVQKVNEN